VAVANYNTETLLRRCLDSVVGQGGLGRVVVADGGSTDGSVAMVRAQFPGAHVIVRPDNPGFGTLANLAIGECTAPVVLLLNSDTWLNANALGSLGAYLSANPRAALAGPRLLNADGTLQRSCFPFPSPLTALLGETGLGFFLGFVPVLRKRHLRTWPHDRSRVVPWVRGAALAVRRDAFAQLGGFDADFFMYFEETDLACRLAAAGWEVHFTPVTEAHHVGGASTIQSRAQMTVQYYASMELFYRRHRKRWEYLTLRAILRGTKGLSLVRDQARMLFARTPEARERLRADVEAWRRIVAGA
jgi:GT2 family glycosyltransferase